MNFYNNNSGVFVVSILFLLFMYYAGNYECSCDRKTKDCYRTEILGVQYNHFYFFIFLGIFFPSYFWTFQILGLLWELLEIVLDRNEQWAMKHLGGCFSNAPRENIENTIFNFKVYKGVEKYMNPIDKFFNIKNSKIHSWHGSIAEVIPNILGFILGIWINKYII